MLYENYQKKIHRIARVLAWLVRFLPLIVAVSVTAAVLLAAKGTVFGWKCDTQITYGEPLTCEAGAFLSGVRYEHREADGEWREGKPLLPGTYRVRAVGTAAFGGFRYSKEAALEILPRDITVRVCNPSLLYGEAFILSGETAQGDTLTCEKYHYRRGDFLTEGETAALYEVTPDPLGVRITRADGTDVTAGYRIRTETAELPITRVAVTLRIPDAAKIYDGKPLVCERYETASGGICEGDIPVGSFPDSLTEAGTAKNEPTFRIFDRGGTDVTECYQITYIYGSLTVEKRPIRITTESAERVYDGGEESFGGFTVDPERRAAEGHTVLPEALPCFGEAGEYANAIRFRAVDAEGIDRTDNYEWTVEAGTVRITKRPLHVTTESAEWIYDGNPHWNEAFLAQGLADTHTASVVRRAEVLDAGEYKNASVIAVRDGEGKDVTRNYGITYLCGSLRITPAPLSIVTDDRETVYDGTVRTDLGYRAQGLMKDHRAQIVRSTSFGDVGEYVNEMDFIIRDAIGRDISFNYELQLTFGTIRVTPLRVVLKTGSAVWTYDGEEHGHESYELVGVLPMHEASVTYVPTVRNAGTAENAIRVKLLTADGTADVTANYAFETQYGTLTVEKRRISARTGDAVWIYSGVENVCTDCEVTSETGLVAGERLVVIDAKPIVNVGETANTDPVWEIVGTRSDNYEIEWSYGTLKVLPRPLLIRPADEEKIYDGKPLCAQTWTYEQESKDLAVWHKLHAAYVGSQTEVGVGTSGFAFIRITDGETDVTENYLLTLGEGRLTVRDKEAPPSGDDGAEDILPDRDFADLRDGGGQTETVIGEVRSDYTGKLYLRRRAYGDFRASGWTPAPVCDMVLPGGYGMNDLISAAIAETGMVPHTAEFRKMKLLLLPYYTAPGTGDYPVSGSDSANVGFSEKYGTGYYVLPETLNPESLRGRLGAYAAYEEEYRAFVYRSYLAVDPETRAYMDGVIEAQGFLLSDPYAVKKIASYIRGAAVLNENYDRAMDGAENIVTAFLGTYREGVSRHYASAAVLIYRALGIPARYAEGYLTDTSAGEFTEITSRAHAWAEVYIDGVGWIPVDVTGKASAAEEETDASRPLLTVEPIYESKVFDGEPLLPSGDIKANGALAALIGKGYTYRVLVSGEQTAVGSCRSGISSFTLYDPSGRDVTSRYRIEYRSGLIEVLPADREIVRIYLSALQKYYDGTPLTLEDGDWRAVGLPDGVTLSLDLRISLTGAGTLSLSDLNARIGTYLSYTLTANGVDVTEQYRLVLAEYEPQDITYAPLRVDPRTVEITAGSATKMFDGAPLSSRGFFVSVGTLAAGDRLRVQTEGSVIYPGSVPNRIVSAVVYNAAGEDVSANYNIRYRDGTLTVLDVE